MSDGEVLGLMSPNETWHGKRIEDMDNEERRQALADAEEAQTRSRANYLSSEGTDDDRRCGFEAMLRARARIREFEDYEVRRYDVV